VVQESGQTEWSKHHEGDKWESNAEEWRWHAKKRAQWSGRRVSGVRRKPMGRRGGRALRGRRRMLV
jgi:hypothetical protein